MLHPDYLPLTASQLAEWEVFERIEPEEGLRADARMAILMSGITNLVLAMNSKQGERIKYTNPEDFHQEWGESAEEIAERMQWKTKRMGVEELKEQLTRWARMHNKSLEKRTIRTKPPRRGGQ